MIVGKCSLYQDPKWRLGDKCLCKEESLKIHGNVFNRQLCHQQTNKMQTVILWAWYWPVCYTQEPLLMFKRICINVYVNQR